MLKFFPPNIILYHVYLLQLEEYNIKRYITALIKHKGFPDSPRRKSIDTTRKLMLIVILSLFLQTILSILLTYGLIHFLRDTSFSFIFFVIIFLLLSYLHYVFLIIVVGLTTPLDIYLKHKMISQAKNKMKNFHNLKIIGIAGSYGKTTMKEVLYSILSQKFKTLKTPKNINTPLGISRQIMHELKPDTEIYIVEMGEYYKGDIEEICRITKPLIAVITGINEAHLARMGSLDNTTQTIFEVVKEMHQDGIVILNADDDRVMQSYQKYISSQGIIYYSAYQEEIGEYQIKNKKFHEDASGISFDLYQKGINLGSYKVGLLGEYIVGDVIGAIQLAQQLGVSLRQIEEGINQLRPVPHRLQPIYNKNTKILVIDDSYNGNPDGVDQAINVLAQFKQQRRIYVTPGLVEGGERKQEIHYNIGKKLASIAGKVVLIKNSVTPDIEKGLLENGFAKENIVWFENAKEAHKNIGKLLREYDVILFQNDWPDNYY